MATMTDEGAMIDVAPPLPLARLDQKRRFSVGGVAIWAVLFLLIIAPVMCFVTLSVSPRVFQQGPEWFTFKYVREAFQGPTGRGIVDSLYVSSVVSILAVTVATTLAWLIHRTNIGGRRVWGIAMWLLLLMPSWMMTLGWTDLLQPFGAAYSFGLNLTYWYHMFYGPTGIILVLTSVSLPFAYFIVSAGLQGLGPEYEDAARIHGANRLKAFQTILPMIAPALLSALAISFAETMSDFGVAFTLGYHSHFPMATYTLFSAINNYPANFSVAAVIAAVLILSTVPPIAFQSRVMRSRSYAVLSGRTRVARRREFAPVPRLLATVGISLFFLFVLGVPIFGALVGSFVKNLGIYSTGGVHFTLTYYHQVFTALNSGKSLVSSLMLSNQLGLVVASCTGFLAVILARRLVVNIGGWSQRVTDVFLLGSIAVPGVVLGVGYIFFYNLSFVTHHIIDLYKTMPLLMIALVASSLPGQTRFMAGPVSQIQPSLNEAARVHGAGRLRSWGATSLPLMSRVLLWGWLLTFTKTISELAIAQILYAPSQEPASVTIESFLANYSPGLGTAMTVLTLVEMLAVIVLATFVYRVVTPRGWRRVGWSGVQT